MAAELERRAKCERLWVIRSVTPAASRRSARSCGLPSSGYRRRALRRGPSWRGVRVQCDELVQSEIKRV
ncbi:hypothetical protein AB870_24405 (plasmid) [Pandoraea faecigallinarum]|uniref:Uncharacterized protein n=1 Tax=Pandoraea faecigallinarum TaxID=656179 RepID=A0A0H3X308_9BURK|nr:hypothetical protein AB870_24405 [Pandoraea faecigallinarum]